MSTSCDCCTEDGGDGCPHGSWITLDRWKGNKVIPNNLRDLQLNGESIWEMLDLDKYKNSNWQWRVVVLGTGNIPDGTTLCLAQNRRDWTKWVSPISEQLSTVLFKLGLGNIRWSDSSLAVHGDLVGGDFTLTLTAFSWSETTDVITWDATATDVQNALQALPNAARAGTIQVTGGPLAADVHMTVACIAPLDIISLTATTNFIGTGPHIVTTTLADGSPFGQNEAQMIAPAWPADGGTYTLSLTAKGTTQTTKPIAANALASEVQSKLTALINCKALPSGDATVTHQFIALQARRYYINFVNTLVLVNLPPLGSASSLTNAPTLVISTPVNSDVYEFRNEFEPLNVGTIWQGYLRKGYGNSGPTDDREYGNRDLRLSPIQFTENTDPVSPGLVDVDELPCGYGMIAGCTPSPPTGASANVGRKNDADQFNVAYAKFIPNTGTIQVTATLGFEIGLQIRCLSCHYSSEFNQWGMYETNEHNYAKVYDRSDRQPYNPTSIYSCNPLDQVCREWWLAASNVPYILKKQFGPDGYDGHIINDRFFAEGVIKARKPVCNPDVVLLGHGYWVEKSMTTPHAKYKCTVQTGLVVEDCGDASQRKPREENIILHPTSNLTRLKEIYGTDFSYWGGWIDFEYSTTGNNLIRCTFDQYDLTDIKVLFLGGFPAGDCPQADSLFTDTRIEQFYYDTVVKALDKDFESTALQPLKRWLDLGGKTLVLDGGAFPQKFLAYLGVSTTVERTAVYGNSISHPLPAGVPTPIANTLNGSRFNNPIFGAELPIWGTEYNEPYFPALYVEPIPHPFTIDVASGIDASGEPQLIQDFTIDGSNVAGQPQISLHVNRGLINISQKSQYDGHFFNLFNDPTSGLRVYTTCIPLVVPGTNAIVIGKVRGVLPIAPWFVANDYVTTPIDYPGIVVEHWNCNFKLRFTDGVTTEETTNIPFNATAEQIRLALESLTLIGPTLTVIGGPLPGSVDITFDSTLIQGTDVALLEVVGPASENFKIEVIREGGIVDGGAVDEIQRISGIIGPSRVVISQVNELVEPDAWGTNWRELTDIGQPGDGSVGGYSELNGQDITGEDALTLFVEVIGGQNPCSQEVVTWYNKDGYGWGLGLSHVAAKQFLLNLLERRDEY